LEYQYSVSVEDMDEVEDDDEHNKWDMLLIHIIYELTLSLLIEK
jgi:hypothetical protein